MPTYNIRTSSIQDWRDTMMSKAEFNAIAAERRANRAGSGFDEFGKGYGIGFSQLVNEGLHTNSAIPSDIYLGRRDSDGVGSSKTYYPKAIISGVIHSIDFTNANVLGLSSAIKLPPAPTVLPYDATLTQQQIDSGVIKHADASNSGLIVNGKFDTNTSGWSAYNSNISVASSQLVVAPTASGANGTFAISTAISCIVGKKYIVEYDFINATSAAYVRIMNDTIAPWVNIYNTTVSGYGRKTFEFTATLPIHYFACGGSASLGTETYTYDNIAVFPADAISRSDLVFLESWHEDVSEKDFVYPLGNTQYLGTTGDSGTPVVGAFAGATTYSLFSDTWQADGALVGKGYVWSTLSDANKKAFVSNPENNCYLDGDKVIQVRYRMRVVAGWGDSWANVDVTKINASPTYGALTYISTTIGMVVPKGKNVSLTNEYGAYSITGCFGSSLDAAILDNNTGQWKATGINTPNGYLGAYEGKCFALPIALVHRRNQGAYHPVYNANGSDKGLQDTLENGRYWYESDSYPYTSISDAMVYGRNKIAVGSGSIASTINGRADVLFYDQIHEGDIIDLRMSSQKVQDYNRLIDREFNKAVAGATRGSEGEWEIKTVLQTFGTAASQHATIAPLSGIVMSDLIGKCFYHNGFSRRITNVTVSTGNWVLVADSTLDRVQNADLIITIPTTRTKSNTLTHTDIIGSPANYPTEWKQSGVSGVPLIVAEDGTSLLPIGGAQTFKLSRKVNGSNASVPVAIGTGIAKVLISHDSGATWNELNSVSHITVSLTNNTIRFESTVGMLSTSIAMVTYQTHTNMATATVNSEVLAIGDVESHNYNTIFNALTNTLIGKTNTNSVSTGIVNSILKLSSYYLTAGKLYSNSYDAPIQHATIGLVGTNSPTVKVFPYLTRSNGKAYLQMVFKEMKYGSYAAPTVVTTASATYTQNMTYKVNVAGCALDGKVVQRTSSSYTGIVDWTLYDVSPTGVIYALVNGASTGFSMYDGDSWGDDSKFNIVDNVSTTTDTNGATVLIGQKRIELPYFIGAAE